MYEFNYHKASSIDDAKKLQSDAEEGKYMSGGMTLLPTLKMRLARPSDVVDLAGISDLSGIEVTGDSVTIKAMTRHAAVAALLVGDGKAAVLKGFGDGDDADAQIIAQACCVPAEHGDPVQQRFFFFFHEQLLSRLLSRRKNREREQADREQRDNTERA